MTPELSDRVAGGLFDRRMVMVGGTLDSEGAGELSARLMTLDATGDAPVILAVQGVRAPCDAAFTVMDTIDLMGVAVLARCSGTVAEAAVGVVAVCAHRWAAPLASFNLRHPPAAASGALGDLQRWAEERQREQQRYVERVAEALRVEPEHLGADMEAAVVLGARDAMAYGLVDQVGGRPPEAVGG